MLSREKMRLVRERRKRARLCPQCGETRPEANRAACRPCLDYNAMIQRSRYVGASVQNMRQRQTDHKTVVGYANATGAK